MQPHQEDLHGRFFDVERVAGKEIDQEEGNSASKLRIVQKLSIELEEGRKVEKDVADVHQKFCFGVRVGLVEWFKDRRKRSARILQQKYSVRGK